MEANGMEAKERERKGIKKKRREGHGRETNERRERGEKRKEKED